MTQKTTDTMIISSQIFYAYEFSIVNRQKMCNETNEKTNEKKTNEQRQEELRRWFESVGDCV